MKLLSVSLSVLNHIVNIVMMLLLSVMTLIVAYQVFTRYVLGFSSSLLQAVVLIFFVALGVIGIALGFRFDSHIAVEMFYNRFPRVIRVAADVLRGILVVGAGLLLLLKGNELVSAGAQAVVPGTSLPMSIMYLCLPISGVLTIIYGIIWFGRLFVPAADNGNQGG